MGLNPRSGGYDCRNSEFLGQNERKTGDIKKTLTWDLSRIVRNSLEVLKSIDLLSQQGISLYIKNYNLETLNDKNEVNPLTQFLIQVLNSVNHTEITTIRQLRKSGYDQYRKTRKVGRKVGFKNDRDQLLIENKDVIKLLKQDHPIRKIMSNTKKSKGIVQKVKKH